jgi:VanZ family protein
MDSLITSEKYAGHPADPARGEGSKPLSLSNPIWRRPHFYSYWLPPMLWGVAILCLSGDLGSGKNTLGILKWLLSRLVDLEPAQLNLINLSVRKAGHAVAYGLMYFLWFRAFRGHADYGPRRACLWSLGLCLFFASMDEVRQWFSHSRGASVYDVLLDMSGTGLAALISGAVWTPGSKPIVTSVAAGGQTIGPE